MEKQTIIYIIGVIFILISFFFFIISLVIIYSNKKTKEWKVYKGKILNSYLLKEEDYHLDIDVHNNSKKTRYKPHIEYEYVLNNKRKTSNQIYHLDINNMFLTSQISKKIIEKYPKNKPVNLYLNPKNNQTILIREVPFINKFIFFIIFFLIGVLFTFFKDKIEHFLA